MHLQFEIIKTASQDISTTMQHSVSIPVMLLCFFGSLIPLIIVVFIFIKSSMEQSYRQIVICRQIMIFLFCYADIAVMGFSGLEAFITKSWSLETWISYAICNVLVWFLIIIFVQIKDYSPFPLTAICFILPLFFNSLIKDKAGCLVVLFVGAIEAEFLLFIAYGISFYLIVFIQLCFCPTPTKIRTIFLVISVILSVILLLMVAIFHIYHHATWIAMIGYFIAGIITTTSMLINGILVIRYYQI